MSFTKALFGYQEDEVNAYLERLKSTHGADQLELECNIENIQDDIKQLNVQVEPLRSKEAEQRQKLEKIRCRIADLYSNSILSSYETDKRLSNEENNKLQSIQKKSEELDKVKETMAQLCEEIEKLTQGFKTVMEEKL